MKCACTDRIASLDRDSMTGDGLTQGSRDKGYHHVIRSDKGYRHVIRSDKGYRHVGLFRGCRPLCEVDRVAGLEVRVTRDTGMRGACEVAGLCVRLIVMRGLK